MHAAGQKACGPVVEALMASGATRPHDSSSFTSLLGGISLGLIHFYLCLLLTAYGHSCGQRRATDAFVLHYDPETHCEESMR